MSRTRLDFTALILAALENERCLDLRYRDLNPHLGLDRRVPNYKVMKQVALRGRFGVAYPFLIALATCAIPLLAPCQWVLGMFWSVRRRLPDAAVHAVVTAPANMRLITAGLDAAGVASPVNADTADLKALCSALGWRAVLSASGDHARLLWRIVAARPGQRQDLLLHARDAFTLLLLARFADARPQDIFVTDDHYQRWAFLLSHCSAQLMVVQHGFLDRGISFAHQFGHAQHVCIRDDSFRRDFTAYYGLGQFVLFGLPLVLLRLPDCDDAVFLASSFPSVDQEIALIRRVKSLLAVPVIVKFHPSHAYDGRKAELAQLASHVCEPGDYPDCRVFVSYGSFMEYDYRASGKATVAIGRSRDMDAAADAVIHALTAGP